MFPTSLLPLASTVLLTVSIIMLTMRWRRLLRDAERRTAYYREIVDELNLVIATHISTIRTWEENCARWENNCRTYREMYERMCEERREKGAEHTAGFEVACNAMNNTPSDVDSGIVNVVLKSPADSPLGRKLLELQEQVHGTPASEPAVIALRLDEESLCRALEDARRGVRS